MGAVGRAACLEPPAAQWKSAMGELGLVGRLRKTLSLRRKVKSESTKSNGITTTKTLPKRSEGGTGRYGKQFAAKNWPTVVVFFLAAACVTLLVLLQQANAEVSMLKEQAELLESRFVGMETFGSLGSSIAAFAVFNIVGILAFAAYGLRNPLKSEQPTRIGQCVIS